MFFDPSDLESEIDLPIKNNNVEVPPAVGRQWLVKNERKTMWLVIYCVVGMSIVMGVLFLIGTYAH